MLWKKIVLFSLLLGGLLACQPPDGTVVEVTRPVVVTLIDEIEVTREVQIVTEVEVEVTRLVEVPLDPAEIARPGTAERPFKLIFQPTADTGVIDVRGGFLLDALTEATGYVFESVAPAPGEDLIDLVCSSPRDTFAILTSEQYVAANQQCGAYAGQVALRFDVPYHIGMVVSRQDQVINVLEDLAFKRIGIPAGNDATNWRLFELELAERGIEPPAELIEYDTSSATMLAVLRGEVDVATGFFNPPILPFDERVWEYGVDRPEVWRDVGVSPTRHPIGYVDVLTAPERGGYRIRDARASVFDVEPTIFDETQIIALSDPIPNETITYSPDFPLAAYGPISQALLAFLNSEACAQSLCSDDFYQWTGLAPVDPAAYAVFDRLQPQAEANTEEGG